ncbi:MAG: D-glycero-beta-D-manno-heptose 1-phosphate adenylyltransferase [Flavobacteriales bacterium]|nr:D-glycero-beta-D-manno-heptose 1-phosphate adenylyltransferase [Flavobacteriales bacterium]
MRSAFKSKILTRSETAKVVRNWQQKGMNVVFTNGCFDLLHRGHIAYLSDAAALGDKLVIGVNSDASVRALKGPNRPLQDEISRMEILAALEFVDAVVLFTEDTPLELLREVMPNTLVKGGDYSRDNIVGADLIEENGGSVRVLPFLPGYSTTAIEQRILQR